MLPNRLELHALHVIYCNHELFVKFKRDLFEQIHQDVLKLTDEDITPLLLLESIFQPDITPVPDSPSNANLELRTFGKINIWYSVFPKLISAWVFKKHREYCNIICSY